MDEEGQPNYPPSNVIDEGAREALLRVHSEGQENKHEYNTIRNTFSDTSPDDDDASFFKFFLRSNGPPQVAVVCLTLALALGSTVGVIPAVMTDRYARLHYNYKGPDCAAFSSANKPIECHDASNDAQNMAAMASFVSNGLTFVTSALVGSISDRRGRRGILLFGMFLSLLAPAALVAIQLFVSLGPELYYAAGCLSGIINWFAVALSSLSDVMPPKWRAPSFGLLMAGFMLGFAISPMLALTLGHVGISTVSFALLLITYVFAVLTPETLSEETRRRCLAKASDAPSSVCDTLCRPMKELLILNRSGLFRLLSLLAFFSGMVSAADHTLLIYYAEEHLDFHDKDVAKMFGMMGLMGIVIQGYVLKQLNESIGERSVVMLAFSCGGVSNFLYGIARAKNAIFVGVAASTFVGMSFPTISAIKANNVNEGEQGRIQGALYSLSSVASAVGPASLRIVYHQTRDTALPGAMFLFACLLYVVATCFAYALPKDLTNSRQMTSKSTSNKTCCTESSYGSTHSEESHSR